MNNFNKRHSFLQRDRRQSRASHGENVTSLMQQVQYCPWNPFKMNELAKIEAGSQEAGNQDSRIVQKINKLANSCIFVEPRRKMDYLRRDSKQKRSDSDKMNKIDLIRKRRDEIRNQVELYRKRLEELRESEEDTARQISQLDKSSRMIEKKCGQDLEKFQLSYDLAFTSFESTSEIIKWKLPQFLKSIGQSSFFKQSHSFQTSYDSFLRKLAPSLGHLELESGVESSINSNANPNDHKKAMDIIDRVKRKIYWRLENYSKSLTNFNLALTIIDELYLSEIPEEIEYIKALETHVHSLEKPFREAPKRIKVSKTRSFNDHDYDSIKNVIGDDVDIDLSNI